MPIIILEGIDGSGKSTFADKILNKVPKGYSKTKIHKGPMVGTPEQDYLKPLSWFGPKDFLVADRWHVGEMIYGPIYRGESLVDGHWNEQIEAQLDIAKAVRVIMSPPLRVIQERLIERGEDYLQDEHVEEVYSFYRDYAEKHGYLLIQEGTEELADEFVKLAIEGKKK
jgi:thymidylate kinase